MISIVIPTRDAGTDLTRCLRAIARQRLDEPVEVIVVDSESTDGSTDVARRHGAHVIPIRRAAFTHGGARNLGASAARGEILVFTSQDAYAASDTWLRSLAAPLRHDERVAGVYGRQLPHENASAAERYFLDFLYGPFPRRQEAARPERLSLETTLFSNVNAAVRRALWKQHPFAVDLPMGEDQDWAVRVLLAGWALVYEPGAAVHHSHPYTLAAAFRRFFDSGATAHRTYLAGGTRAARTLRGSALAYGRGELAWLWRTGQRRAIPYTVVYELAKFAGLQIGARQQRLPRAVVRRLSALPDHWR